MSFLILWSICYMLNLCLFLNKACMAVKKKYKTISLKEIMPTTPSSFSSPYFSPSLPFPYFPFSFFSLLLTFCLSEVKVLQKGQKIQLLQRLGCIDRSILQLSPKSWAFFLLKAHHTRDPTIKIHLYPTKHNLYIIIWVDKMWLTWYLNL